MKVLEEWWKNNVIFIVVADKKLQDFGFLNLLKFNQAKFWSAPYPLIIIIFINKASPIKKKKDNSID